MIITRVTNTDNIRYAYLNIFPDQFRTEKEKQNPTWVKNTMDYFANVAYAQYRKNRDGFARNYDLMKGILTWGDFYKRADPEVRDFADTVLGNQETLPDYVKHYPIINPPVNEMVGELANRPDNHRIRAFDDDSQNEELEYKTNIYQQLVLEQAKQEILMEHGGEDISDEDLQSMTMDKAKDYITDFTSIGERWSNDTLAAMKAQFNMREKSEDAFRDLLISSREFFHVFEDNSKTGFNVEVINGKYYWELGVPDKKYTSAVSGELGTPYANGFVKVMEISEIIETFPEISKEEIDHLRTNLQDYGLINVRPSNLFNDRTGTDTIQYDTYSRLILEERMMIESEMKENRDELMDWMGLTNSVASFGYKYTVVVAYWASKLLVGRLIYLDEDGNPQMTMVDETYKKSPNEISVEWGWINQWYRGLRIGPDVFHVAPFKLLDYSPIIGLKHEVKNTTPRSLVDLMKPYQMIYNVAMNQLWALLEKEIGVVYNINIRKIPIPKDADAQDAIEIWEEEARRRGIVFEDDSPENMKVPGNNTNNSRPIDLTRTSEIESRYNLAVQMKLECWELVGMNRQRLGQARPTETATGVQSNLSQSFAQTEPYFAAHRYVLDQVYQAMVDAAQYIESHKPYSTLSYISNEGEQIYLRVAGSDLRGRDFKLFSTSRPEDQQLFSEIRALAQPALQNGASFYEIIELYSTNSIRQMKKTFKDLKEKQDAMMQQQQQMEQQKIEQTSQIAQAQLQEASREKELDRINENYNEAENRLNKKEVALIQQLGRNPSATADNDNNGVSDALEITRETNSQLEIQKKYDLEMAKLSHERQSLGEQSKLEKEKIKVERDKMKNDMDMAKLDSKTKTRIAKMKPKPKPPAKKKK